MISADDVTAHGWSASAMGNVNRWIGLTGEVSGNYKSADRIGLRLTGSSDHSFFVGPQINFRSDEFTPFIRVLLGGVRGDLDFSGLTESESTFASRSGGGVDVWFDRSFGLRLGVDYERLRSDGQFRVNVGVVWRSADRF